PPTVIAHPVATPARALPAATAPSPKMELTQRVGDKLQPVAEKGLGETPKINVVSTIGLQGFNLVVQFFNDRNQSQKFEEAWAKMKPSVETVLNENPALGCMLYIYYVTQDKVGAENDSPLQYGALFDYIVPSYGYTANDARANMQHRPAEMRASVGRGTITASPLWFAPKKKWLEIGNFPAPFAAVGIATFVPGRTTLTNVKFTANDGFDDKMWDDEDLTIPAGMIPRFYYLRPPAEIQFYSAGSAYSVDVDVESAHPAQVIDAKMGKNVVPVVSLDTWPYDGKAAMIYPVDNATANLFQTAPATHDTYNYLRRYKNFHLIRWVHPDNMRLLADRT
ncbi:MAG: hypothetical protein WCL32_25655, partial [Planctomycetota bacterium]